MKRIEVCENILSMVYNNYVVCACARACMMCKRMYGVLLSVTGQGEESVRGGPIF